MNCLSCDVEIIPEVTWKNVFILDRPNLLCKDCESSLEKISGNRCKRCSRPSKGNVCSDCQWWEKQMDRDSLDFNYSTFKYNTRMQEMIAKWKYRGDYYLGEAFRFSFLASFYERFSFLKKEAIVVPIPLSEERQLERCFNQAEMLAGFLPIKMKNALSRVHGEKQSKKSRRERICTENPFFLTQTLNKPVILVDDIYTTGTTLRHAAQLLKDSGTPSVYSMTLVRG
ncbi:ComF family protein [Oceanobacillus senegalensis]|uniref:ComF family protein n=1 Tax=Oceanobacillus senegalensis TaxID=1936063 RepID=UPI000A308968|nr:ComF family protein [Oceanobacillus senegalensis]